MFHYLCRWRARQRKASLQGTGGMSPELLLGVGSSGRVGGLGGGTLSLNAVDIKAVNLVEVIGKHSTHSSEMMWIIALFILRRNICVFLTIFLLL